MKNYLFLFWLVAIFYFNPIQGISQITFEREIPSYIPVDAFQSGDGKYYILTGGPYPAVHRLDSLGRFERYQTMDIDYPFLYEIGHTSKGIFAIGSEDQSRIVLFTADFDLNNSKLTTLVAGGGSTSSATGLADDGIAVLTSVQVAGQWQVKLSRLNSNLDVVWSKVFGEGQYTVAEAVYETATGDLILVAHNAQGACIVMKTSSAGDLLWRKDLTGGDFLQIADSEFFEEQVLIFGKASATSMELVEVNVEGTITRRDVMLTGAASNLMDSRFAVSAQGEIAITSRAETKKGFNLSIYDSTRKPKSAVYYDRVYNDFTTAKEIAPASDGYLVLATISSGEISLAIKTDEHGNSGSSFPFEILPTPEIPATWTSSGFYWIDVDNDHKKELLVVSGTIKVYSYNKMSKTFMEILNVLPGELTYIKSLSLADVDNDGFMDIYANRYNAGVNGGLYPVNNLLFKNNGDGTFRTVTDMNITNDNSPTLESFWIDLNNDQYLDLFLLNNDRDQAYSNNGDGTFTKWDPSNFEGKTDWIYPRTYFWIDLNKDGYIDYVANNNNKTEIMLSLGGTAFEKHSFLEYFNIDSWTLPRGIQEFVPGYFNGKKVMLILDGDGVFCEYTGKMYKQNEIPEGLEIQSGATRGEFVDFDNDTDLDVFIAGNGFYRNDYNSGFTKYRNVSAGGLNSFTWADVDQNGALDMVGSTGQFSLFRNVSAQNWMKILLRGNASPPMGTGATVALKANGKWAYQSITAGAGNHDQIGYEAFFGIGKSATVDSIRVTWPSGCISEYSNISGNQVFSIEENCSGQAPVVNYDYRVCLGDVLAININSPGEKFSWFTSLSSPSIAESDASVTIDTLTRSTVLFVANTDSTLVSRRIPVRITVSPKLVFEIQKDILGSEEFRFFTLPELENYKWIVNDEMVSTDQTMTLHTEGSYSVCVESDKGCITTVCKDFVITEREKDLRAGYDVFPTIITQRLTVRGNSGQPFYIKVFNSLGQQKYNNRGKSEYDIDFRELPSGQYLVQINDAKTYRVVSIR